MLSRTPSIYAAPSTRTRRIPRTISMIRWRVTNERAVRSLGWEGRKRGGVGAPRALPVVPDPRTPASTHTARPCPRLFHPAVPDLVDRELCAIRLASEYAHFRSW